MSAVAAACACRAMVLICASTSAAPWVAVPAL
jgi:hypothetical protein